MRWILCGKGGAVIQALEHACAQGDEVWAIGASGDDGHDDWQPSYKAAAARIGVRFEQPRRINDPAFTERLAEFGADALISIQYDQILRAPLFERIGCPCLNLHFALLPRHRGVAPIAWAITEGDAEAGVTLHHMVPAIDAGDVIAQRRVPIAPDENARSLYDRVSDAAAALFRESHPFPPDLLARRLEQSEAGACYHRNGDFDFSRRTVDWGRPALALQRWLRAMIFPPLQQPEVVLDGRRLAILAVGSDVAPATDAAPGTIVRVRDGGVDVAAADGILHLPRLEALDADAGSTVALVEGARFDAPHGENEENAP